MSVLSQKVLVVALSSIVISLASMGVSTYSATRNVQTTPMATSIPNSLEQEFNWTTGETVDVQGNLYTYIGYESNDYGTGWHGITLRLAVWQNSWLEVTYSLKLFSSESTNPTFIADLR